MPELPESQANCRDPRIELGDEQKVFVRVAFRGGDGSEVFDGRLLDVSRNGAKLTIARGVPFGEKVDLHVVIPELDLDFTVGAVVSWSRQETDDRWLIGCRFDPGLSDATIDRLARGGYLERRRSPRYPISLEATASFELSEHGFSVWVQDFSTDGFSLFSPRPGEIDQRLRLEIAGEDGKQIVISARICWSVSVDDGYLVGCSLLNARDFQHLWELTYKTHANQPLLPRVSLRQPRWTLAWFAALMAFMVAYPVVIWLVSTPRSVPIARAADMEVSRRQSAERDEDAPLRMAKPSTATGASSSQTSPLDSGKVAPQTDGTGPQDLTQRQQVSAAKQSKWIEEQTLELERRENQLKQQAQQLDQQATALRDEQILWAGKRKDQQAQLAAERHRFETARLALQVERQAFEVQQTAWQQTQRESAAAKKAWETERQAPLQARQVGEEERRKLVAEKEAWQRQRRKLLAAREDHGSSAPRNDVIETGSAKTTGTLQQKAPNRTAASGEEGTPRGVDSVAVGGPVTPVDPNATDRRLGRTAFHRGRTLLIQRRNEQAARSLAQAIEFDAGEPFYYYLLALAQYQLNDPASATRSVTQAARLEQTRPIQGWGDRMQRFQGTARLWLEQARAKAKRVAVNELATG